MRFKTNEEFRKEYGESWDRIGVTWHTQMNCLFGMQLTPSMEKEARALKSEDDAFRYQDGNGRSWHLQRWMFIDENVDVAALLRRLCTVNGITVEDVAFTALTLLRKEGKKK